MKKSTKVQASWISALGQIDPLKEIQVARERLMQGLAYRKMALDEKRENQANDWSKGLIGDVSREQTSFTA